MQNLEHYFYFNFFYLFGKGRSSRTVPVLEASSFSGPLAIRPTLEMIQEEYFETSERREGARDNGLS